MGWGRHPLSRALDYECYHRPSLKAAGEAVVTVALQDLRAPYLVCHPRELCCRNLCSCLDVHAAFLSSVVFGFVLWKRFISPVTVIISMLRTGNLGRSGAWEDYVCTRYLLRRHVLLTSHACLPQHGVRRALTLVLTVGTHILAFHLSMGQP